MAKLEINNFLTCIFSVFYFKIVLLRIIICVKNVFNFWFEIKDFYQKLFDKNMEQIFFDYFEKYWKKMFIHKTTTWLENNKGRKKHCKHFTSFLTLFPLRFLSCRLWLVLQGVQRQTENQHEEVLQERLWWVNRQTHSSSVTWRSWLCFYRKT